MNISDVVKATDAISVKRVFGDPFEKDGMTVIPAAIVAGGGGGGGGHDDKQEGEGGGAGFGGRPAGAFVVRGDHVTWQPAVDPNRIVAALAAVAVVYLLTRTRVAKYRAWAQRGRGTRSSRGCSCTQSEATRT
jgi:uncharacterized spore protein YtfJ